MSDLHFRLKRCFKAVFPALKEEEIPQADLHSVADWDSISAINLVTVIEEEFEIEVAPDDVLVMSSYRGILDYLESSHRLTALAMLKTCMEIGVENLEIARVCL